MFESDESKNMTFSKILFTLICNIPTILCVLGAIYIMTQQKEGWGWLLFVAVLLSSTVNFTSSEKNKSQERPEVVQ